MNRVKNVLSRSVLAALLSLALGATTAHALVVPTVVGTSAADAVFAEPLPGNSDGAIVNHIVALIDGVPEHQSPPARIRVALHSIDQMAVVNALLDKASNGVDVQVVKSGHSSLGPAAQILSNNLGPSRFRYCNSSGGGCVSTHPSGSMHSKFFLFSRTGVHSNVTWFGSANMTAATGTQTWNDGLTVYDNPELFSRFESRIWGPLWSQTSYPNNDFYQWWSNQGYLEAPSAGITVHASPEQDSDLVNDRLHELTPNAGCQILVGVMDFNRTDVARKLAQMKGAGCTVLVLVGMEEPPTPSIQHSGAGCGASQMSADVRGILVGAGIPIRKKRIHDKMMLLRANNRSGGVVLTGSHNLTRAALRENDEILVEVESPGAYSAFSDHWWQAWMNSCEG